MSVGFQAPTVPVAAYRRHSVAWTGVAWILAGVAWVSAAAGIVTVVSAGEEPAELANWVMDEVTAVVYGIVVTMMLPRSRHPVVWLMAVTAIGCGLSGFATGYGLLDGADVARGLTFYLPYWAWVPGVYATVTVVPLLAVPEVRRPRWLIALSIVAIALATLPNLTAVVPGLPPNPFGVDLGWWQQHRGTIGLWAHRSIGVLGALVALWLVRRLRAAPPAQRVGLRWLLAGHLAMVVAIAAFVVPTPASWAESVAEVSGTLLLVAQAFLPAALLVLVLGQRLWGIQTRIDRGVVWAVMTVSVALANLLLLALVARLFPVDSTLAVAVTVGLVGLGATVVRAQVQRRVDQLIYGTGTDPARLLSKVEQDEVDLDALAAALRVGLRLSDVRIVPAVQAASEGPSGVQAGQATAYDGDVVIPLISRGREVGHLVASPRPGERLDRRTTGMIAEVAGLVAMTIDLAQSVDALTAARARMASIRHEERRTLRRDLHDGLGPALAGIRLGLIAARGQQGRDPAAAEELLDTLERELALQGEEVRRLSRSLVPLALEDGDLASALTTLAERFAGETLRIDVQVEPDLELSPGVQVALYQMASEALLNVQRHAGAAWARVVVRRRADGDLVFTVTDDGVGLRPGSVDGIGLRSMRERAAELGAVVSVGPAGPDGGTEVALRLPRQ